MRSLELSFAAFANKKIKSALTVLTMVMFASQSKDFLLTLLPWAHQLLLALKAESTITIYTEPAWGELYSASVMIPITITASMRGNNGYPSAFMSCPQGAWALGVWCDMYPPHKHLVLTFRHFVSVTFPFSSSPVVGCDGYILETVWYS